MPKRGGYQAKKRVPGSIDCWCAIYYPTREIINTEAVRGRAGTDWYQKESAGRDYPAANDPV